MPVAQLAQLRQILFGRVNDAAGVPDRLDHHGRHRLGTLQVDHVVHTARHARPSVGERLDDGIAARADLLALPALIRAAKVDRAGNCVFYASARNFNIPAAMAGRLTIVEAEQVVEVGEIAPDDVHLPGVFVQRVVALTPEQAADKKIEKRTVRPRPEVDQ